MKKRMAAISAAIIGISCSSPEAVVVAGQTGEENTGNDHLLEEYLPEDFPKETVSLFETEESRFAKQVPDLFSIGEKGKESEGSWTEEETEESAKAGPFESGMEEESGAEEETEADAKAGRTEEEQASSEMKDLLIPQKLNIVIDPWEQDGKEQIYSPQYTIKNAGECAGTLTFLNLTCRPREMSGVEVKTDRNGLHEGGKKSVYLELLFGNGDRIVLSEAGAEYKAELKPGEELTFCFSGAVNEYAESEWENEDISIDVMYSWAADAGDDNADPDDQTGDVSEAGEGTKGQEETEEEILEENTEENILGEKKEDLVQGESSLTADTWEADGDGRIVSEDYILRNTEEAKGTLTISELVCEIEKQSEIVWKTEKEELEASEGRAVYIEMELKNGERPVFHQDGQENLEGTGYKVELEPGEELVFRFAGETKGMRPEDLTAHEIVVKASWTWVLDETMYGQEVPDRVTKGKEQEEGIEDVGEREETGTDF